MTITLGAAQILKATSGDDGKSVCVDVGWYANSVGHPDITTLADYSFLTELSWAPTQYAWESTEKPSTFECDWKTDGLLPPTRRTKTPRASGSPDSPRASPYTSRHAASPGSRTRSLR